MTNKQHAPGTQKVRRDALGGKRGDGHRRTARIKRPDPERIRRGTCDPTLTGAAGLVDFGAFLRRTGVDAELRHLFDDMKASPMVVYPMAAQLRLAIDLFVAGETRVFGVEALAADPVFVHLAGGVVPSIDTVYRDLVRFDADRCAILERLVAKHGLAKVARLRGDWAHMDVDTSVTPVDGEHEGALPGPNPKFRGRPSLHPMFARVAETDTLVGAVLRPGDTGLGDADSEDIGAWTRRTRAALHSRTKLCVRIDAGGDCAGIMRSIHEEHAYFLIKARLTQDVVSALMAEDNWKTVERDALGRPSRQVAELTFRRDSWGDLPVRAIAVRTNERESRQIALWPGVDLDSVHVYLTNRQDDADAIAWDYDGRAGIEPMIAELKGALGIGYFSSWHFEANHAAMLLKMLTHNLVRNWVDAEHRALRSWRLPWIRRALIRVPGRMTRSGRRRWLHLPPTSALARQRE
jgi:hypothetical protein